MGLLQKIGTLALGTVLAASMASNASAEEPKPFGKVAGYYDTRGKPTATLTLGASDLPLGTKFFSFLDFAAEKDNVDNLTAPYGEFRLSKKADSGLGVAAEYDRDFSQKEGVTRVGFFFEPNMRRSRPHSFLGLKLYPTATNNHGLQLGLYGNTSLLGGAITLDGFLDYNFTPEKVVADLQAGYRLKGNLYAVVEGRHNGFLGSNGRGIGFGLEWKL